ncbi:MAG TPA: hypothetical protein VMK65_03360 [Longimicrobiales bacterium]|nr:hypothetical protein [Longimicrobiales bacterium]
MDAAKGTSGDPTVLDELPEFTLLEPDEPGESIEALAPSSPEPPRGRAVIPPAVLAARMQRYSIWLTLCTLALLLLNVSDLQRGAVLWFAAGVTAAFALLCAVTVVILNAIAWNFARLTEELRGGRAAQDLR